MLIGADILLRSCLYCLISLIFVLGEISTSSAAEFTVNSNQDVDDLEPGNGLCVAYIIVFPPFVLPYCTVRAAIEETNKLPGPDTIHIPSGNFILEVEGINENNSATGDLDITDTLLIKGEGVNQTYVDGNRLDRVFDIPTENTEVTIEHLTITNGELPSLLAANQKGGGGIRNRGTLNLRNVAITNNLVNGSASGDNGGGVQNSSNCILENSTIQGNLAANGGGIFNGSIGTLKIFSTTINSNDTANGGGLTNEGRAEVINSTFSGNRSSSSGGGIYNLSQLEILQSTLAGNISNGPGGGVYNSGDTWLTNTIIAGNTDTNCFLDQLIHSLGSNLDDGTSCTLDSETDLINIDPKLDSLQNHGGPTNTHGLLIGSPAVDRGQDLTSLGITTDQRGNQRPDGQAFDIGSFETRKRSAVPLLTPLLFYGTK